MQQEEEQQHIRGCTHPTESQVCNRWHLQMPRLLQLPQRQQLLVMLVAVLACR